MPMANTDPVLMGFRARLEGLYGDRLACVVLFGSRARGEARPDSDYDVAVFLRGMTDRWAEFDRLDPVVSDLFLRFGALVQALPYDEGRYGDPSSLMRNVREEGIDV